MLSPDFIRFSSSTFECQIKSNLKDLQEQKNFCDVTIACENRHVKAHQIILSGGSLLFKNILKQHSHSHPLIFLSDVKFSHLLKMLDFMYQGEVIIDQKELCDFISVANDLKIKGLAEDTVKDLKQFECFIDEGNKKKKQRLEDGIADYNINIRRDDDRIPVEDIVKDSKQSEHFAHEDNSRKNKPMVTIPLKNLNFDIDIKVEKVDLRCDPRVHKYEEDSSTEKILEKNQLEDDISTSVKIGKNILNMGERGLRIRDIAKLSDNTLQSQSISSEKDISGNFNYSNLNGKLFPVHERVEEALQSSSENAFMCMQCNKNYPSELYLTKHIKTVHVEYTYPCEKCDYTAKLKRHLKSHIQSKHDTVTYPCEKCDYTAKLKSQLKSHINSAHDGVVYSCDKCDYTAKQRGNLNRHINTVHYGVTYPCDKCDYVANLRESLKSHINSAHDGVVYSCDKCDYTTKQRGNLNRHINAVHDGDGVVYFCDKCDYTTKKRGNLNRHINSVHDGVTYPCDKCDYVSNWRDGLTRHKLKKHI